MCVCVYMCISRCAGGLEPAIHFVSHTLKQNVRKSTHAHTRERGWEGQGEGDRAKFEQERVRGRQSARGRGSVRERERAGERMRARENLLRISVTILRLSAANKLPYQSPCCCNTLKELTVLFKRHTQ